MEKGVFGVLLLAVVVLASVRAQADYELVVRPDAVTFRENGVELKADRFEEKELSPNPCVGWGWCEHWFATLNAPGDADKTDAVDDWQIHYDVSYHYVVMSSNDGATLPNDFTSYYYDLDTYPRTWKTAQYKSKGPNWARTSQYTDIDNWDYTGIQPTNRITWNYRVVNLNGVPTAFVDALELWAGSSELM